MRNRNNWVKISRYILNWEWYDDMNVLKLFIHLILECNYKDKQWRGIQVNRGQLISGRKKLSKKTGLSEQQIRTATKKLLLSKELHKETIKNYSVYTLVNYEKWQGVNDENMSCEVININTNWIKLFRSFLNWEWYDNIIVFKLFLHLILESNYTDKQWREIHVKRGQLVFDIKKLSVKIGLTEQQMKFAEQKLLSTKEITKETIHNYSVYTLVNYEKWQGVSEQLEGEVTSKRTNEGTTVFTNNQPQLKKGKERKEKKKERIYIDNSSSFSDLTAYEFLKKEDAPAMEVFQMQNKNKNIKDWSKFLNNYNCKVDEEGIEWTKKKLMARLKRMAGNWKDIRYTTNNSNDVPLRDQPQMRRIR